MLRSFAAFLAVVSISCTAQDPTVPAYFSKTGDRMAHIILLCDTGLWNQLAVDYDVDRNDTDNRRLFGKLVALHKLFTCRQAENGSVGEIIPIPYFWHYCQPNPRAAITVNGRQNLSNTTCERVPAVFFRDLVSAAPLYSHSDCSSFSAFGWCSEREMAYACLLALIGYDAHVIAPWCHAWTEVKLPMRNRKGEKVDILVTVDNTFDRMGVSTDDFNPYDNIYERKSRMGHNAVRAMTVGPNPRIRIEHGFNEYVRTNLVQSAGVL